MLKSLVSVCKNMITQFEIYFKGTFHIELQVHFYFNFRDGIRIDELNVATAARLLQHELRKNYCFKK